MSVYDTAINGLMTQSRAMQSHANNLLQSTTIGAMPDGSSGLPRDVLTLDGNSVPVEESVIGMITAKTGYSANAKLIGVQRDMDRELLNIFS